jgi:signal peptidase I
MRGERLRVVAVHAANDGANVKPGSSASSFGLCTPTDRVHNNAGEAMRLLDRAQGRIPQPWRTIVDWSITIAIAIAFVLAFQAAVAKPYVIPSPSMEPTLHCAKPVEHCEGRFSDRVVANRLAYRFRDPERGEIVVFEAPAAADRCGQGDGGSPFVKRIVGLPGEVVSARDGVIAINGERLVEPYIAPSRRGHESGNWPRVAAGEYFVLGDNRTRSCDSRMWGTVSRSDLIGPVMLTYWPPKRLSFR